MLVRGVPGSGKEVREDALLTRWLSTSKRSMKPWRGMNRKGDDMTEVKFQIEATTDAEENTPYLDLTMVVKAANMQQATIQAEDLLKRYMRVPFLWTITSIRQRRY